MTAMASAVNDDGHGSVKSGWSTSGRCFVVGVWRSIFFSWVLGMFAMLFGGFHGCFMQIKLGFPRNASSVYSGAAAWLWLLGQLRRALPLLGG